MLELGTEGNIVFSDEVSNEMAFSACNLLLPFNPRSAECIISKWVLTAEEAHLIKVKDADS